MAHLQYMPGDPRLVDQLVCELKSKGIFDQFRKECIADVDTRPAYQNLRQRVESSVSTFLSRQCWKPDLNKNQLREKLRKHILDGNFLEQGVERIVDQVVNPKVASVFIPQVEDLVYNYLGIPRKKIEPETIEPKPEDLLPTDLEAVSPGSVKSNEDKNDVPEIDDKDKMEVDKQEIEKPKQETEISNDVEMSEVPPLQSQVKSNESEGIDKCLIPLPSEDIKLENIPAPVNSPPKSTNAKVELDNIALPHEPNLSTDIPLPAEIPKADKEPYFKPIQLNSEDSNSSSDSSLRRNVSPLTPIRNYNNENSCDAQQGFDTDTDAKSDVKTAPSSFRFTIENKDEKSRENSTTNPEVTEKSEQTEKIDLSYQFNNQVNINTYNTPMYDDSSNSNNLHIDYESDVNSKTNIELKPEVENSQDSAKKEKKSDEKKISHKSSHRSRDSSTHSSRKDKRSDSKHSTSRDSSRHDLKSSRDDKSKSNKEKERSKDRSEKKDNRDNRDSSKHRSSHKSSSKDKDSKSYRSSSSSHRHSSKSSEEKKSSSSKDKEKNPDYSRDRSKDKHRDSKSSSSRDKDRKSSSSSKKPEDKDKKKDKKDTDDHYSSSGRGNHSRRSTDRDSNDGSSSSKGSQNHTSSKSTETKKDSKTSSTKSDNTSTSGSSPSPSDKEHVMKDNLKLLVSQFKPVVRVDNHLETPIATPPRLPFVPDVTLKKPKFAANLQEAKKMMKMRKFLDEEQKRMNQEAALLLEFQANVRPSLSQVYSNIPGPELEFACVSNQVQDTPYEVNVPVDDIEQKLASLEDSGEKNLHNVMETKPNAAQINEIIGVNVNDENIVFEEIVLDDIEVSTEEVNKLENQNSTLDTEDKVENTYDENKPFAELMDEITEYSKASEIKTKTDIEEKSITEIQENMENGERNCPQEIVESKLTETKINTYTDNKYFEVTVIAEELSESEEIDFEPKQEDVETKIEQQQITNETELAINETILQNNDKDTKEQNIIATENIIPEVDITPKPEELQYFTEQEKYNAELERLEFSNFLKSYTESVNTSHKMFIINCDTYEENIVKEVALTMGDFEVINYYKNGHLKLPNTTTNVLKDEALSNEVTFTVESNKYEENSPLFSPVKSECSFELCSDYDSKLDDINKKSRQEVMEIILGSVMDRTDITEADYIDIPERETDGIICEEASETENVNTLESSEVEIEKNSLKRSIEEVQSSENNNRSVLTPKKMRKMSDSDQISSTTDESEETSNNNKMSSVRSKYLGKARRVGLSRPKRSNLSNSPSSDKSVENYVQNTPPTSAPPAPAPNGKIRPTPRTKVQRYDTSDLYKPKLHYLSRRHNVS